jgi:hypothetical protein
MPKLKSRSQIRPICSRCASRFQELAQARDYEMPGQDVFDATFKRVPPKFRRAARSHKYDWGRDIQAPDSFDEISPIAISQGEFRDDHGLLARRVEEINCCSDAARPLNNQSARFDVLRYGGFRTPGAHENHYSCSSLSLHQFSNAA